MSHSMDFEGLKRKLYLSYHQDGILDLVIGMSILGFGISMNLDTGAYIILSWIGFLLYAPLKNAITIPRMGYVQFDEARKHKTKLALMLGMGVLAFSLFLGLYVFMRGESFSNDFEAWFRQYYLLVLGSFPAIILIGAAFLTGVYRLLIHAFLIVGIIFAGIQLEIHEPYFVMVLGAIILLIGSWLLFRFLQKYPQVDKDDDNGLS